MKQLSIISIIFSIFIGILTWSYSTPLKAKGTAVIYTMTNDGKNGNKPVTVAIPDNLTIKQQELLGFAYHVAKQDGFKYPAYLQGILLQESRACSVKNFRVAGLTNRVGDRYFGAMQIKLAAAKNVMSRYPEMWKYLESRTDEELQAHLILDDQFNIRVASKYMLLMGINENPDRAITAYNVGPGGVEFVNVSTHPYTNRVKFFSFMTRKEINIQVKDNGLQLSGNQKI